MNHCNRDPYAIRVPKNSEFRILNFELQEFLYNQTLWGMGIWNYFTIYILNNNFINSIKEDLIQ